jgi:hypothetical protein
VIGKYTKTTWPPIQQARKADSEAYKQTNVNLARLAREEIYIDGPRVGRYTSTSVSYQVEQTSVKLSELSLPRGIVPGTDDVRVIRPSRPPSRDPVVSFTPRKRQILAKPIPLLSPKVEIPDEEVIYLEAGGEYGNVIDPLDLYEEVVEEIPTILATNSEEEIPTTLAANSEVGIEATTNPEGDIESECGLYSEGEEGTATEADSTCQLLASCQPLLASCQSPVSVSIPESGAPLPLGLPAAISPLVPDSEAERQETLKTLRDCKPYGYSNNNNFL